MSANGHANSKKVAVITGGIRGIGLGIAECLARDGFNLVLGYNTNAERAEETKNMIQDMYSVEVACSGGDLARPDSLEAMFKVARDVFGDVTAFVHNAGLWPGLTTQHTAQMPETVDFSDDNFYDFFDYFFRVYPVTFKRGLVLAQQFPGFQRAVAISMPGCNATQAVQGSSEAPGQAKAAMEYLVRVNAVLLGPRGVTVNAVLPGVIATEAWARVGLQEHSEVRVKDMPVQRLGTREDVGEAVAFLCSPRSGMITGIALPVDGGRHLVGHRPPPPKAEQESARAPAATGAAVPTA